MQYVVLLALCALSFGAWGADYPTKPVRIVVPYVAGASFDTIARTITQPMSDGLKQQVVIDNRPGATGIIGTELVARASPDGYTLGLFGGNQALVSAVRESLPFDLMKDFAPISRVATLDNVVTVHPSLNVTTLKDLIALLKANPGKYHYGSGGTGGDTHFAGALFAQMAGVNIVHVPYKGGGLAVTGLVGNEVQLMVVNMISAEPHARAGRLRAIAVAAPARSPLMPNVPTTAEAGLPGMEWRQWYAFFAPAGTPRPVIAKIRAELKRVIGEPRVRAKLANQGATPMFESPAELQKFVADTIATSRKIANVANIRID
jgi:tripartite-type tricarboxylate transporter receptor subunit TctC